MRQVFIHLDNMACFIAWAAGFSAGTYLGMLIDERMALGTQITRIITNEDISALIQALKNNHQGITIVDGKGARGPVKLIFTIVKRANKKEVLDMIQIHTPNSFYSIEDVKNFEHGVFTENGKSSAKSRLFKINAAK